MWDVYIDIVDVDVVVIIIIVSEAYEKWELSVEIYGVIRDDNGWEWMDRNKMQTRARETGSFE